MDKDLDPLVINKAKSLARDNSIVVSTYLNNFSSTRTEQYVEEDWPRFVDKAKKILASPAHKDGDIELDGLHFADRQKLILRLGVAHHYLAPSDVDLAKRLLGRYVSDDIASKSFYAPLKIKGDDPTWMETAQAKSIYVKGMEVNYPGLDPRRGLLGMDDSPNSHLYKNQAYGNELIPIQSRWYRYIHDAFLALGTLYFIKLIIEVMSRIF